MTFWYPYLNVATRFFAIATIALFAGNCLPAAPATDVARFDKYVGKYPSGLLKGEPDVKRRLQTLLGANYSLFMERLQVESPIENVKGVLVAKGCMAHGCGVEEAVLLIDLSGGKFHCAIRSDSYSGKVKTFSEDPAHLPSAALKYALGE